MPLRSERRFISISNVKSGMMIEFNYTKKSGGGGSYIVLVVDPNRKNEHATESQLHGFVIDELTDDQLVEFFASFNKSINLDYTDRRASVVEGLNTDEAYSTFSTSKYVKDRSYRTFNLTAMSQVRQILLGSVGD
jgi:hypothetical protein